MRLKFINFISFVATIIFLSQPLAWGQPTTWSLRPRSYGNRNDSYSEKLPPWIDKKLWKRFFKFNLGKPPTLISVQGNPYTALRELKESLREVPDTEPVEGYPWLQNEPFVALVLEINYPAFTQHIMIIDRVPYIKSHVKIISEGRIKIEEYEFIVHLSIYPVHNSIHLHSVSVGRELVSDFRNRGLFSPTFRKIVNKLRRDYPEMKISTVAAARATEHWFKKYFAAHFASPVEYEEVTQYVRIPLEDAPSLMLGWIIPSPIPNPPNPSSQNLPAQDLLPQFSI